VLPKLLKITLNIINWIHCIYLLSYFKLYMIILNLKISMYIFFF
jgi:hypothetical protein